MPQGSLTSATIAIYGWIGAKGTIEPGLVEMNKLRRENNELQQIIARSPSIWSVEKITKIRTIPLNKVRLAKRLGVARSTLTTVPERKNR